MPGHFRRNCGGRAAFADDTVLFVLRRPDKLGCAVALFGGQFGGLERDADTNVMFGLQGLRDAVGQHLRILRCGFGGRLHRSFVRQFRGSSPAGFCDDVPLGVGAVDDALLKPYPGRAPCGSSSGSAAVMKGFKGSGTAFSSAYGTGSPARKNRPSITALTLSTIGPAGGGLGSFTGLTRISHTLAAHLANHLAASGLVLPHHITLDMPWSSSPPGDQSITQSERPECEISGLRVHAPT